MANEYPMKSDPIVWLAVMSLLVGVVVLDGFSGTDGIAPVMTVGLAVVAYGYFQRGRHRGDDDVAYPFSPPPRLRLRLRLRLRAG